MHRSGFLIVFLILAVISFLMDWYVYRGLRTLSADWSSNRSRSLLLWAYLIISVGITIVFIAGIGSFSTSQGMRPFHEWMLSLFLMMLISKLLFITVLSLGDLVRFGAGMVNATQHRQAQGTDSVFPERRKFISELAILLAAIPFTATLYAMLRGKYDYKVHRHTLYFEDLPEAFDGFTIAQISDVHSGSFDNKAAVQRGINLIKAQNADLFVFTGDLVNNVADEITPYIDMFSQIKAPYGQYSILGNHDYGDYIQWESAQAKTKNLQELKNQHQKLGYKLMLDENVRISKKNQHIVLIGVQNWGRGFIQIGDLDKALTGVDPADFKVLLSHDPTHWEEKVRYHQVPVHLTLSGHTHGAQFGIEAAGLRWSPVQYQYLDWAGLVSRNNRYLYVNRGFGFLAFSGRLGIWPEITVITLKRKTA
jgi:predicted MPP superfamily phosphohydrolase